jgi:hypothetical protein
MTTAIYDFAAIGNALAPARPDLPALRTLAGSSEPQPDPTGDSEILSLFARWHFLERSVPIDRDGECDVAALVAADEARDEIEAVPASGAVGLAIKVFLELSRGNHRKGSNGDPTALGSDSDCDPQLVRDLVRFAPVLEPLCRDFLAESDAAARVRP